MADSKISTVVLKVDLECERCYKKIRKVLCKIQDKAKIKTISYDEKSNAVTVSGPFDAEKVCRKLCCEAGRVIKEMHVKGKDGGDKPKADKDAGGKPEKKEKEKDGGKPEKKDAGKPEKEGKADKAAGKPDKEKGGGKDAKPEKKVKFEFDDGPPVAAAKPGKAMQTMPPGVGKADLGPLLEKMMAANGKQQQGPEPPRGEPIPLPVAAAAQGVAVPSIWPAPAGSVSCYSYNPGCYDQTPSYYGGCRCGSCAAAAKPGYYGGAPAYDHQGWYYGNRHPYYHHQQQQPCYEDPNASCSVM